MVSWCMDRKYNTKDGERIVNGAECSAPLTMVEVTAKLVDVRGSYIKVDWSMKERSLA